MLLAFGDSHHSKTALEQIAEIIRREEPQIFVHTGDNYGDFYSLKKKTKVQGYGVRGNCDFGLLLGVKEELLFEYRNKKILLVHGHKHSAKHTYKVLLERAKELGAEAVIFGHSHVQLALKYQGIWLVNPGSISLPRGGSPPGYARIIVDGSEIKTELVQV